MEAENIEGQSSRCQPGANGSVGEESKSVLCVSGVRTDFRNYLSGNRVTIQSGGNIERYPGITHEKPKHPDYAVKSVRLSSFSGWNSSEMDPEQMAEAGFFYTGVRDCVRCFFCGGGMNDWQDGDTAWIEHARWFPNCAFVKQCKGEDFIYLCRMSNIENLTNDGTRQNEVPPGWNMEGNRQDVEDQFIEDLNSSAAKLIMGMGYEQADVETAVKTVREKYGNVELRAQHILEFLLDNNYVIRNAATGYSSNLQTGNSPTGNNNQASSNRKENDRVSPHTFVFSKNESRETEGVNSEEQKSLLEENQQLKDRMTCKICMDKEACIVFIPCGHMVSCIECAHALRKCAVCRTIIQGTVRAYPA